MQIRLTEARDIPNLKSVLDETGLFPSEMLEEMLRGFLSDDLSEDLWLSCLDEGKVIGFCYAVPETMTDGTWNMLAIAVLPSRQGGGIGGAIVRQLEDELRKRGQRLLIVDTSGRDEFAPTRGFYRKNGYREEARIRDFWTAGDDKIVFSKSLK